MTVKTSYHKVTRMMDLYLKGYSQTEISEKINVDQSTVSLHINKFKAAVTQQGLEITAKEYGNMDILQSLHDLAGELKGAKLTIEEAKTGLRVHRVLDKCGVDEKKYPDLIEVCSKVNSDGFLDSAMELSRLEKATGLSYKEVVAAYQKTSQQLKEATGKLNEATAQLQTSTKALGDLKKKRELAATELRSYLEQLGLNMQRLQKVEALAIALKKAAVSDAALGDYLTHQTELSKAGISLGVFVEILNKAKVLTTKDQGTGLLEMLTEYSGLSGTINVLQSSADELKKQTSTLTEKRKSLVEIEGIIAKVKARKTDLDKAVASLSKDKAAYEQLLEDIKKLKANKLALERELIPLGQYKQDLTRGIEELEQKVANLKEVETRHQSLLASNSEIEAKIKSQQSQSGVLHSFLGFVGASSQAEIEKFVRILPGLLADSWGKGYSAKLLRDHILKTLSGGTMHTLTCTSCNTKFVVDKPSQRSSGGYYCPVCSYSLYVEVDKDEAAILQSKMIGQTPQKIELKPVVSAPVTSTGIKWVPVKRTEEVK